MLVLTSLVGGPVLLAPAGAYLWVSGFGAQPTVPAASIALTSNTSLVEGEKSYTVSSATPRLTYDRLAFQVDGEPFPLTGGCAALERHVALCRGGFEGNATDEVRAGDTLLLGGLSPGGTLRVLDVSSNSVLLVMSVR